MPPDLLKLLTVLPEGIGTSARCVLMVLAASADDTGRCTISRDRLAQLTGLSVRRLHDAPHALQRAGLITAGQWEGKVYVRRLTVGVAPLAEHESSSATVAKNSVCVAQDAEPLPLPAATDPPTTVKKAVEKL